MSQENRQGVERTHAMTRNSPRHAVIGRLCAGNQARLWILMLLLARGTAAYPDPLASLSQLTPVNDLLFFSTSDDGSTENGSHLWRSDGTPDGTFRITNGKPGAEGSSLDDLTNVNGQLFFTDGQDLWRSNGTSDGTLLVRDTSGPSSLTDVDCKLYFIQSGGPGWVLCRSDGTSEGTQVVQGMPDSSTERYSRPMELLEEGTVLVLDHDRGFDLPFWLTSVQGKLFFLKASELWVTDGSREGTRLVKLLDGYARSLNAAGDKLFLTVESGHGPGTALWTSDGTPDGTVLLKEMSGC